MRAAMFCLLLLISLPAPGQQVTHGPILGRLSHQGVGIWVRTDRPGAFRTLPHAEAVQDDELNPSGLFHFSFEFACGSHNSNNHWYSDEGARPANGPFQYGPGACDIRWSTFFLNDIPRQSLQHPTYCVVQINNVFDNPQKLGQSPWVAFPRPQVTFQYDQGMTGKLLYVESIVARL